MFLKESFSPNSPGIIPAPLGKMGPSFSKQIPVGNQIPKREKNPWAPKFPSQGEPRLKKVKIKPKKVFHKPPNP